MYQAVTSNRRCPVSYVSPNYRSKKDLKAALSAGKTVDVYQPGLGTIPVDGTVYLEGPHYPEPHRWYATGEMRDGKLVSVK